MPATKSYSISRRLTTLNMAVSGAALLVACAAFFAYDWLTFRRSMVQNLSIQAQIIGTNSIAALLFDDPRSAKDTLSALKASSHIVSAAIYKPDGSRFAAYGPEVTELASSQAPPAMLQGQVQSEAFEASRVSLARLIILEGKPVGLVRIESDLKEIDARLVRYAGIAVAVLGVSLLAAWAVSARSKRAISEPLVQLAKTARAVSADKNYSLRAAPTLHAELSVLVEAFNAMLDQIQQRDADLRQAREELEHRVEERTAQLASANKELEAFSYSVSHDLRAPLRHIDGFATLLANRFGAGLDPAAQRYLNHVRTGAKNMGRLVDDLLNMARIGRQELLRAPTDVNLMVREVIQELQPEVQDRPIAWRISDLPTLYCDPGLMKIVFTNLLSNAVKYTRRADAPVIEVDCLSRDPAVTIRIRDNGAGFEQEYAHKLFGVFQRLHRAEDFEGTGVGLATVQRIIHKHGGTIWAEGEVDKGATFSFTLATHSADELA